MKTKPQKLKRYVVDDVDIHHIALAWWRLCRKQEQQMELQLKGKA